MGSNRAAIAAMTRALRRHVALPTCMPTRAALDIARNVAQVLALDPTEDVERALGATLTHRRRFYGLMFMRSLGHALDDGARAWRRAVES